MAMTTAEKKDYYTIFHVDTIKEWCLSLGMDMGVPGKTKDQLVAALALMPNLMVPEAIRQQQNPAPTPERSTFAEMHRLTERDEITFYLMTFESIMNVHDVKKDRWPQILCPYLTGKAQEAFFNMDPTQRKDYDNVSKAILHQYRSSTLI
jgi:hypothetical protein